MAVSFGCHASFRQERSAVTEPEVFRAVTRQRTPLEWAMNCKSLTPIPLGQFLASGQADLLGETPEFLEER